MADVKRMRGYAERHVFSASEIAAYEDARWFVEYLSVDFTEEEQDALRCHEVARAAGAVLKLPVQDGRYGRINHTWLWTSERSQHVLDVYAVGRAPMVQLVDASALGSPEMTAYKPMLLEALKLSTPIDGALVDRIRACFVRGLARRQHIEDLANEADELTPHGDGGRR